MGNPTCDLCLKTTKLDEVSKAPDSWKEDGVELICEACRRDAEKVLDKVQAIAFDLRGTIIKRAMRAWRLKRLEKPTTTDTGGE